MATQQEIRIEDLITNPLNPREHNPRNIGMIAESMQRFGMTVPAVIDRKTRKILAGHGRYEAAAQIGITELNDLSIHPWDPGKFNVIPVDDWTEEDQDVYAILENRSAELAGWNLENMAKMRDLGRTDLGFYPEELSDMFLALHSQPKPPSFDDLAEEYGSSTEEQFWPSIELRISPDTYAQYQEIMTSLPGENDAERFSALLDLADAALSGDLAS